jgi:hypothetical protein
MDVLGASLLIALLSPVFVAVAALVFLLEGTPILFSAPLSRIAAASSMHSSFAPWVATPTRCCSVIPHCVMPSTRTSN